MRSGYDVIIVGGGVIGLSLARELRRMGVKSIALVERGRIGSEASWAAAGMLAPNAENEVIDDHYRLCDESRLMFPRLADELAVETGIDIELDRTGTLYAAFTEADSEHIRTRYTRQLAAGIPVERLSGQETLKAEPHLAPNVRESLFFPNDWQVENRRLLAALKASAEIAGIEFIENTAVEAVRTVNERVAGISCADGDLTAEIVVLATGAWTPLIKIPDMGPFDVRPIRGQMLSFDAPKRFFDRVVYSPRGYLVPRADGRLLVGATVEDVGFDKSTTEAGRAELMAAAVEAAPELSGMNIAEHWSGLRPRSADGLPVIGEISGIEGLFVATAHYRNGILLAPLTGKLIADEIVTGTASPFLYAFGPARMTDRGFNAKA